MKINGKAFLIGMVISCMYFFLATFTTNIRMFSLRAFIAGGGVGI
ncbi:MAG: hypothetical protein ACFFDK_06235 [Promethearchaeota archaeon]